MSNQSNTNSKLSLSLSDLKSFTYFGNWIAKHFGDDIKLRDIDPANIKTAIDGIIRSEAFRSMSDDDRAKFNDAFNKLLSNLGEIPKMRQDD